MSAIMRGRGVKSQYVTSDLVASRLILLPDKNRHRFFLTAHPGNSQVAGQGVWIHLVKGNEAAASGKTVNAAGVDLAEDAASADPGGIDATNANSGIFLPFGANFGEDASGQMIFSGAITAIGTAAGQKLIVLAY